MIKFLDKINDTSGELDILRTKIRDKKLSCSRLQIVNGDNRFWNVNKSEFLLLSKFHDIARQCVEDVGLKSHKKIILMVNYISAENAPNGSGGGWHVDSLRDQYKLFMYLTDCEIKENGPFTLFTSGNNLKDKFQIYKNYLLKNKFRFSDDLINKLFAKGFQSTPILKSALLPYFVKTSLVHRGEKITSGERMMVTAYIYDKIPSSISKHL